MAIITISRQVAALGDEIAEATAKKLHYSFINRKEIERRIIALGFDKETLKKYDERKPGFFASLKYNSPISSLENSSKFVAIVVLFIFLFLHSLNNVLISTLSSDGNS